MLLPNDDESEESEMFLLPNDAFQYLFYNELRNFGNGGNDRVQKEVRNLTAFANSIVEGMKVVTSAPAPAVVPEGGEKSPHIH